MKRAAEFKKAPKSKMPLKRPQKGTVEVYQRVGVWGGEWFWRLKASNGRILADSAEGYKKKDYAIHAAERMIDFDANEATILLEVKESPESGTPPESTHMRVELKLSADSVKGGTSVTGTVTHFPTPVSDMVVQLSSNKGAATVPSSVVILTGQPSAMFTITTDPVLQDTDVTIKAVHERETTAKLHILA